MQTGYPSIDKPHCTEATLFEKYPIIPSVNIYTLFKLISRKNLDKPAVNCLEVRATYRKLLNDAVIISLALKEIGVRKGDIVSVCMPNLYQALAVFFGCNRIGAVVTFLDAVAPSDEIISYLNQFESPIFVAYDKDKDYLNKVKESTKVKHIITLTPDESKSIEFLSDFAVVKTDYTISYPALAQIALGRKNRMELFHSKKEDALILFTSGSTGKPKSVVLTNENVIAAEMYAMNTSHTENITGPKTLICVPFSYPYGFVTSALTSLLWGKESILAPNIGKETIKYYFDKRPSIVFGSPALLDLIMGNLPNDQDLSSVTHFISGGDFLTAQHATRGNEFFARHGAPYVELGNGFGNAETVSIGSTPVGVPLRQETAGKLLVGTNVMVVDPDTFEEKRCGEEGLLCVSGKHVFKEYYKDPKLTAEVKFIHEGREYYNTGTLGIIDEQGYFTVTGRQSRFYIMSSLNKVYCDNVQNIIASYDGVKDCAVVKVSDAEKLYVNKAFIVLDDRYSESEETMQYIWKCLYTSIDSVTGGRVQLKPYEIPAYIEFVKELPRIPGSEKIDYSALEKLAEDALLKRVCAGK